MQFKHSLLTALAFSFLTWSLPAESAQDNAKCQSNPIFKKFAGEFMDGCERVRFKELELWRWKKADDPKSGSEKFKVEGEYWYYFNGIEKDSNGRHPGAIEVRRNFENAVKEAKGTILYQDRVSVTYLIKRPGGEFWGQAGCGRGGDDCSAIMHKIVRVAAMEQSVVVSSDQIAKSMGEEGRVVFYGIYFDTDKATLKTESGPTLAEMAKWLKANASNKVFIVGHTDMQGPVERNQKLSRDRAIAVIAALTKDHAIKADRMAAEGVGPLAPVASNAEEAGRARNRRVEMVLR